MIRVRQYLLDLYEIQKIDLSLRDQAKSRDILPQALQKLEATASTLRRQTTTLAEQSAQTLKEARSLHNLLEAERNKIRKWEARLNDIRNQREYQALQRETEGSRRANRDNEAKISALYARKESLDNDLVTAQERLVQVELELGVEKEKVTNETLAMNALIEAEQSRRDALVPRIPKALFKTYDTIRHRRMGVGLCPVSHGSCTGCNIRLPPQLYNILQRGDTIEQCPSCRRVMFWERLLESPTPSKNDLEVSDSTPVASG